MGFTFEKLGAKVQTSFSDSGGGVGPGTYLQGWEEIKYTHSSSTVKKHLSEDP
jgi:hypothetical protein